MTETDIVNIMVNTVYYAPIQANGFPGTWQNTTTIKVPRHDATAVVVEMP